MAFPVSIESHMVFKPISIIKVIIKMVIDIRVIEFGFLYKNIPKITPLNNALRVNPGKYALLGKSIIPKISAIVAVTPPKTGPSTIDAMAMGKNPNPTRIIGVSIEKNLVNITCKAINNPINTNFFVLFKKKHLLFSLMAKITT